MSHRWWLTTHAHLRSVSLVEGSSEIDSLICAIAIVMYLLCHTAHQFSATALGVSVVYTNMPENIRIQYVWYGHIWHFANPTKKICLLTPLCRRALRLLSAASPFLESSWPGRNRNLTGCKRKVRVCVYKSIYKWQFVCFWLCARETVLACKLSK